MSKVRDYFGLSKEDIKNILEDQEYKCSICDKDLGDDVNVDHCHLYNEVRAILCTHCNLGLGHFKDNPEALRRAADYLENWDDIHSDHLKNHDYYIGE
jgi:DNA-directed RNA polymerase subunit RPC12/RpoP